MLLLFLCWTVAGIAIAAWLRAAVRARALQHVEPANGRERHLLERSDGLAHVWADDAPRCLLCGERRRGRRTHGHACPGLVVLDAELRRQQPR